MLEKSPKIITGIIAFLIYFILVGLVIYYFNTKSIDKPKHYVKKNEHRIQVSLSRAKSSKKIKNKSSKKLKSKTEPIHKVISSKKIKPPKISKPTAKKKIKKKIIKEKIVKKTIKKKEKKLKKISKKIIKKEEKKVVKVKKVKTADLFTKIKTKNNVQHKKKEKPKKHIPMVKQKLTKKRSSSASDHIRNILKKQTMKDKGIENAYFSKVQALLETWPAQSEFAGQKAIVRISVKPTGKFDFKVQTESNNMQFNKELIAFLKQLQRLGLGRHQAGRSYEFNVEFIAKE